MAAVAELVPRGKTVSAAYLRKALAKIYSFFKFIEYLFEYISTQEKENDCRMNIYNVVMKQINLGIVQKYCRARITAP
jgi:hypothetical protein